MMSSLVQFTAELVGKAGLKICDPRKRGKTPASGILVTRVQEGGASAAWNLSLSGGREIREGQTVIAVNDTSLLGLSYAEAKEVLVEASRSNAPYILTLEDSDPGQSGSSSHVPGRLGASPVSSWSSAPEDASDSSPAASPPVARVSASPLDHSPPPQVEPPELVSAPRVSEAYPGWLEYEVLLQPPRSALGLKIRKPPRTAPQGILVRQIVPGRAVFHLNRSQEHRGEHTVSEQDIILSINGRSVEGIGYPEARQLLKEASTDLQEPLRLLLLHKPRDLPNHFPSTSLLSASSYVSESPNTSPHQSRPSSSSRSRSSLGEEDEGVFDPSRQPFDFLSRSDRAEREPSPAGRPSSNAASSESRGLFEFTAVFRGPMSLGLKIRARAPGLGQIVVRQVLDAGAAVEWNVSRARAQDLDAIIRPGDVITAIGGTQLTGPDRKTGSGSTSAFVSWRS